jgi:hypothetical protein
MLHLLAGLVVLASVPIWARMSGKRVLWFAIGETMGLAIGAGMHDTGAGIGIGMALGIAMSLACGKERG